MGFLRAGILLMLGLFNQNASAHLTVVGFEETLSGKNQIRFRQFTSEQKRAGYTNCYYSPSAGTFVCEAPNKPKVYFR